MKEGIALGLGLDAGHLQLVDVANSEPVNNQSNTPAITRNLGGLDGGGRGIDLGTTILALENVGVGSNGVGS